MITTARLGVILKNETNIFEMFPFEIEELGDEIIVYSTFFHPLLKRGWVGDLTYHCYKGHMTSGGSKIDNKVDNVDLMTIKDVLLRNVQCYKVTSDAMTEWKYKFLKY